MGTFYKSIVISKLKVEKEELDPEVAYFIPVDLIGCVATCSYKGAGKHGREGRILVDSRLSLPQQKVLGVILNGDRASVGDDEYVLEMGRVLVIQLRECS